MTLLLLPVIAVAAVVALAMSVPGRRVAQWAGIAVALAVGLGVLEAVVVLGLQGTSDDETGTDNSPADVEAAAEAGDDPAGTTATTSTSASSPSAGVRPIDAVMVELDPMMHSRSRRVRSTTSKTATCSSSRRR